MIGTVISKDRDHIPTIYVVFLGTLGHVGNYITYIEYVGENEKEAYAYTHHNDFDSLSIWQGGKNIRTIEKFR